MTTSALLTDPVRAWAPFVPAPDDPWDLPRVAHLHRRAGFAAPWAVLQRDLRDGPDRSVDRMLDGEPTTSDGRSAAESDGLFDGMAAQLAPSASLTRLQGIWLYRMIFTAHPLRERMTLFWHNHFATSNTKVNNTGLDAAPERPAADPRPGPLPDAPGGDRQGPGDADLARFDGQPQGASE